MAVLDPLTALHNRRYLSSHLDTLFEESADRGRALSVLLIDVDRFKAINDTHGHDAGDDVLRELAFRLRRNIRGIDLACRHGGEEFVVVMPHTSLYSAYVVGECLRQCLAAAPFIVGANNLPVNVTASIGVAALEYENDTPELIMKHADQALYCAKRDGLAIGSSTMPPKALDVTAHCLRPAANHLDGVQNGGSGRQGHFLTRIPT